MSNRIVALVDGSIYSESVCRHAAWLAGHLSVPVELLHVLGRRETSETGDLSGAIGLGARTALLNELSELDRQRAKLGKMRGHAILDDARAIIQAENGATVTPRLLRGDLVEIMEAEEQKGLRAIVIGKRGEGADFARGHLGSNLERIARVTHAPLLVASRAFLPVSKALVAYDDSPSAQAAIGRIATSPVFAGLEMTLVHAGAETPPLQKAMQQAARQLDHAGLPTRIRFIEGEPEDALVKCVHAEKFDLLVMGAYGHSRIRSLIIGSTTSAMMRAVKIPVLLFR